MPNIISDKPIPDPRHIAVVTAMAKLLHGAAEQTGQPHGVQLDGLLSCYASLLVRHPCYWEGAIYGLRSFADRLQQLQTDQLAAAADAEKAAAAAIAGAMRPAA